MYDLVLRPPVRTLLSDASSCAVGGYCVETGMWWRCDLSTEERSRSKGCGVHDEDDVSINVI